MDALQLLKLSDGAMASYASGKLPLAKAIALSKLPHWAQTELLSLAPALSDKRFELLTNEKRYSILKEPINV